MKNSKSKNAMGLSLAKNVELVRSGNIQAFVHVIDQTSPTVTSIALSIVRDIDNAEDVAQQVYIKIWEQIQTLKNTASFLPWLRQITRNTAFNFLRSSKVANTISGEQAEQLLDSYCDPKQDQTDILQRSQCSEIINYFIDCLPKEDREVVLLYYREGSSTKQVARLLDLSEANVRKKISRTRAKLKISITEKCGNILLTTTPAIGFGSLLISSIAAPSPVAAATMSSIASAHNASWINKVLMLFGGAFLGVFSAMVAILLGSSYQLKELKSPDLRRQLIRDRNRFIVFFIIRISI